MISGSLSFLGMMSVLVVTVSVPGAAGKAEMRAWCSSLAGSVFPVRSARRIAAFTSLRMVVMLIMERLLLSCVCCLDGDTSTGEKFRCFKLCLICGGVQVKIYDCLQGVAVHRGGVENLDESAQASGESRRLYPVTVSVFRTVLRSPIV